MKLLKLLTLSWNAFCVRGCAFNLVVPKGKHKGKFLTKQWNMVTTFDNLSQVLGLGCPGGHAHITTEGSYLTRLSGRYTEEMAARFHRFYAAVIPNQVLKYTETDFCANGLVSSKSSLLDLVQ